MTDTPESIIVDDNLNGTIYVYSTHDEAAATWRYDEGADSRQLARGLAEHYAQQLAKKRRCQLWTNY